VWDDAEERGDAEGDDLIEPPVPPGLGQLSAPLQAFVEFFDIDQDLVGAAATASPALKATDEPIERWVPLLPEAERNSLLVRAARGEPIGAELLRRLMEAEGFTVNPEEWWHFDYNDWRSYAIGNVTFDKIR
jgi:hypothetical protein